MKWVKRIIAIILLIATICFIGYTSYTCSQTEKNLTDIVQDIGGQDD